jgi:hypothetical protein
MIQAIPVGTRVKFGCESDRIVGHVDGISIRSESHVTYEIVWWNGRARQSAWMAEREFVVDADGARAVPVGFRVARAG